MADFLTRMAAVKEEHVACRRRLVPEAALERDAAGASAPRPFAGALARRRPAIIAEIKRRSPSRGQIRAGADAVSTALLYERGGAAAISVLTVAEGFGGSLEDLVAVRRAVDLPLLRKDFLVDPYELLEARAAGADAVLLIVALLGGRLAGMLRAAGDLGLQSLVEVHDERELERALAAGATLVGINNRDLGTLAVDVRTAPALAPLVPPGITVVAESGYRLPADLFPALDAGIGAFLVGETLMSAQDPRGLLEAFLRVGGEG